MVDQKITELATVTAPDHDDLFKTSSGGTDKKYTKQLLSNIFNVKDYGAVGDGSTDDTAAMNAAATACLAVQGTLFVPESSNWYRCNGQVDFRGIRHVIMYGGIITFYAGTGLLMGKSTGTLEICHLEVNVLRYPYVHTAGYVGCEMYNVISSEVIIRRATGCEWGIKIIGNNSGYVGYNNYYLDEITYDKNGMLLTREGTGWNNENNYFGGDFEGNEAGARCCVEIIEGGAHHFWKPSFQYSNITVNGIIFTGATGNYVHGCRVEGDVDNCVAQFNNFSGTVPSTDNVFEVGSQSAGKLVYVNEHGCNNNFVYSQANGLTPMISLLEVTSMRYAYDDGSYFHVPGFALYDMAAQKALRKRSVGIVKKSDDEYLHVTGGDPIGVFVDTSDVKSFYIRNKTTPSSFNWFVACYDAAGALLYGSTPYYVNGRYDSVCSTYFYEGNVWTAGLIFRDEVKKAFIGFFNWEESYNDTAGFEILVAPCSRIPRVWTGYDGPREFPGHYFASQAPTKAVFWQGDVVYNDAAATGGAPGWQCVFSLRTALNGGEPQGETNMVVDSIVGVVSGDIIAVALDTGLWHWTTVNGTPSGSTIVITAALPSAAADNQPVHVLRWKAMANNT